MESQNVLTNLQRVIITQYGHVIVLLSYYFPLTYLYRDKIIPGHEFQTCITFSTHYYIAVQGDAGEFFLL